MMAEGTDTVGLSSDNDPGRSLPGGEAPMEEEGEGGDEKRRESGLTDAQRQVLERCLHALTHATNDSHTLAALLLITRLCPASVLDKPTLHRIFEAVGLSLPARLLVTAIRGDQNSGLPPEELLSLGTALLAALSTDQDMASHPHLLTTVPLLLGILQDGPTWSKQKAAGQETNTTEESQMKTEQKRQGKDSEVPLDDSTSTVKGPDNVAKSETSTAGDRNTDTCGEEPDSSFQENSASPRLDKAMALDCFQVLAAVCALPRGPDQLLSRGAIPALCKALEQNQTCSYEKGLPLLGCLLSGRTRDKAWAKHPAELLSLVVRLSKDFCQAKDQARLDLCVQLPQFLPPQGGIVEGEELKGVVVRLWEVLRPMLQAKLKPKQIGSVLVLCACLLDLYGWEPVGLPKTCCLLVNRACVEVRMALEEPPGTDLSPEMQHTLTGCYRIMEAAMEQACSQQVSERDPPPQVTISGLSLKQSRQVLGVLEEAFSAVIYYLQQVDTSRYGDPFVFATFRCLCSWLAEETSCLKEEVTALLPFLIGYARSHLQDENQDHGLSHWMCEMSIYEGGVAWTGKDALRYLLPALCHLSAEDGPRKVLLTLDTPALLVAYLSQSWGLVKGKSGGASTRDSSMETACSALLNFAVTEPERVRDDPSFSTLQTILSEALPVLVHKPHLLVLAANYCTLGLMIGRLKHHTGPVDAGQRRFFSAALRFLRGALDSGSGSGPVRVSPVWVDWWDEAGELWRLGLQALGGCVRAQPWIPTLVKEEGWLKHILTMLATCSALPDPHTQGALEEALCALADQCPICKQEITDTVKGNRKGAVSYMSNLKKSVGVK